MDDKTTHHEQDLWRGRLAAVLVVLALGLCVGLSLLAAGGMAVMRVVRSARQPDATVRLVPTPAPLAELTVPPSADLDRDRAGPVNLLLVQSESNDIYLVSPESGDMQRLTSDASPRHYYGQPTWAPDASSVAWSELHLENTGGGPGSALYHQRLSESIASRIDTGPYVPFYIYFSPDGRRIAFLSNWERELALRIAEVHDDESAVALAAQGQPLYFDWAADGRRFLAHIGSDRLGVYDVDGTRTSVAAMPGSFAAPGWLADDLLLYALARPTGERLVIGDTTGRVQKVLAEYDGKVTFTASPDGRRVAYAITRLSVPTNAFGPLSVVDIATGDTQVVTRAPVLAFFWSPDARLLAYLTPDDPSQDRVSASLQHEEAWLRWHVWDGDDSYRLARFVPTDTYLLEYLRWFDQYALSMTPWAPDSSAFVFAGRLESGLSGIWVQPAASDSTPRRVAAGAYAAWSPR